MPEEKMQDALKPQPLKRPLDKLAMGGDVASLNSLLKLMNDPRITGAEVPKGADVLAVASDKTGATMIATDPVLSQPVKTKPVPNPIVARAPTNPAKLFYTGLIGAGKDHIAEQTGATIFGFAEPLYHLAEYFFGVAVNAKEGKQIPGVRQFLQAAGQWGRNEVTEQYPLTPARACFVSMIRSLGEAGRFDTEHEVDWSSYGRNKDIWLNAANARVENFLAKSPEARVAITNVRFQNEYKRLSEFGWTGFHVMCSPETRLKRVPGVDSKDASEQLAAFLNNDVTRKISAQPKGAKLRAIWNCSTPSPSSRLYSVAEFLQTIKATTSEETMILTGE